jgi:peptidyl-prolyl cis-trans isomerase C
MGNSPAEPATTRLNATLGRFLLAIVLLIVFAGCGGHSTVKVGGSSRATTTNNSDGKTASKLAADDVAVVGSAHIPQPFFNSLMSLEKQSAKQAGQAFPKPGTANYETAKSDAVNALVQAYERQAKAATLGITVTGKQVQAELDKIIKQNFAGSTAKYTASLKTEGITDAFARFYYVKTPLIGEKLYANITKGVTVSPADIASYYAAHISTYQKPETRNLRFILVASETSAQSIYSQLVAGNDQTWCTLAKKYSQDPSSKDKCGKLTVTKGETVPVFDNVAFSQATNAVHEPVYDSAQYKAYFIIEPLSPINPQTRTPESKVAASIKKTLLTKAKTNVASAWSTNLTKSFCTGNQVVYQVGFEPSPDPCHPGVKTSTITTSKEPPESQPAGTPQTAPQSTPTPPATGDPCIDSWNAWITGVGGSYAHAVLQANIALIGPSSTGLCILQLGQRTSLAGVEFDQNASGQWSHVPSSGGPGAGDAAINPNATLTPTG